MVDPNQNQLDEDASLDMAEMDTISATAMLIDDLSCEDPSVKLHAFLKLTKIAEVLGPERTRDELIPLITDLIEKIDDNSDLMSTLADELGKIIPYIGSEEHLPILLKALEMISSNDEQVVREKSIESLCKISQIMTNQQHTDHFLPMVKRLAKGETYQMRISSCGLLHCTYPKVDGENQNILRQQFIELCKDDTPMVRRSAIKAMKKFSEVIDKPIVINDFIPILKNLLKDEQDSVRVAAFENACNMSSYFSKGDIKDTLVPSLLECATDSKSWRLRFIVVENTQKILSMIDEEDINTKVLNYISTLLTDIEHEVRSQTILELAKIANVCNKSLFADKILPVLGTSLVKDTSEHVRFSLASSICEIGQILGSEISTKSIIPICLTIYKDDNGDVRQQLISSLKTLVSVLNEESIDQNILPIVVSCATDKNWRVRLLIAKYIPELSQSLSLKIFKEKLMQIVLNFLMDSAYLIREQITISFPLLKEKYGKDWYEQIIKEKLLEFSKQERYTIRLSTLQMICQLKDSFSKEFLLTSILPIIISMKSDPVPNIRFNVSKTLSAIAQLVPEQKIKKEIFPILQEMLKDEDFDVKFFAEKALQSDSIRNNCF